MVKWRNDTWPRAEEPLPDFVAGWFHADQLSLVGYFQLSYEEQEAIFEVFCSGLTDVIAAMWWNNDVLPREIYESRMAKFAYERVFAANSLLEKFQAPHRRKAMRIIAMLRNIGLEERKNGERQD